MSSDDDFQPTLYNKRLRKRRKVDKTKRANESGSTQSVKRRANTTKSAEPKESERGISTRTRTKTRGKNTETRGKKSDTLDCHNQEAEVGGGTQLRVILRRLDLKPGTRYLIKTRQQAMKQKKAEKVNKVSRDDWPRRHHYKRSVLSLPHVDVMHRYSTLDTHDRTLNEHGKRTIDDVIDSSDDELFLIKGKPNRKKYRKEELSDSFHEAFYLSSSDESIINSSSDEDIFVSSADENEATEKGPDDRQRRLMKRRTLQYYRTLSQLWV